MDNSRIRRHYGDGLVDVLQDTYFVVCGAGALGSNIVDSLVRQGATKVKAIDNDRVEETNIATQVYGRHHIHQIKATALRGYLYQYFGIAIDISIKTLNEKTVNKELQMAHLVIDTFDNSASRRIVHEHCIKNSIACLHVGMNGGVGGARWSQNGYIVPDDTGEDVCDYPVARNLISILTGVSIELVFYYISTGEMLNKAVTLSDLRIWSQ